MVFAYPSCLNQAEEQDDGKAAWFELSKRHWKGKEANVRDSAFSKRTQGFPLHLPEKFRDLEIFGLQAYSGKAKLVVLADPSLSVKKRDEAEHSHTGKHLLRTSHRSHKWMILIYICGFADGLLLSKITIMISKNSFERIMTCK